MKSSDAIARWLEEKGIVHAFGIVGGGNVEIWDAITRHQKTNIVCVHHEQAAAMAACAYQRACGRLALCLLTTGAGSANAITGVLAGYMDRTPLLVISGNEASRYMEKGTRVWGVQGYDSAGAASFFTKQAERVMGGPGVIQALEMAHKEALRAPGGPCWVDIPKDVQGALV